MLLFPVQGEEGFVVVVEEAAVLESSQHQIGHPLVSSPTVPFGVAPPALASYPTAKMNLVVTDSDFNTLLS